MNLAASKQTAIRLPTVSVGRKRDQAVKESLLTSTRTRMPAKGEVQKSFLPQTI